MTEAGNNFCLFFDKPKSYKIDDFTPLNGLKGLYFIFTQDVYINYPFAQSRLLYIGMSELKTIGVGKRLKGHFLGDSKNLGLVNYQKKHELLFTHIDFEMVRSLWGHKIQDLENYFILDFVVNYGAYPICNNKSSNKILRKNLKANFEIDWKYFE